MAKKIVYEAVSENLTNLGGPMGTKSTSTNWTKLFSDPDDAKEYAMKDYEKQTRGQREPIMHKDWIKTKEGWRTEDLSYPL